MVELSPTLRSTSRQSAHEAIACLGRLADVFRARRRLLAAHVGLSERQWAVLDGIAESDFMPSLFAKKQESSPASVSKVLRQLLDLGLVSVSLSAVDGRQRRYELTEAGRERLARIGQLRERAIEQIWLGLSAEELTAFTRFGDKLLGALQRYEDPTPSAKPDAAEAMSVNLAPAGEGAGLPRVDP